MKVGEIRIKVPWGYIAAKAWGNANNPHVLAFHGVQDNAAAFDKLVTHLPTSYYYLCFDLPGHGRSSHIPPFFPIHTVDYVLSHKFIVDHFGKDKYIFIGHSYGAQISSLFASLYPQYVEKLIFLDSVHNFPITAGLYYEYLRGKYNIIINLYEKMSTRKPPSYTYEEALDKISNQRTYGPLNRESAKRLLERGSIPSEDGKYQLSLDPRMKAIFSPLHDCRYSMEYLNKTPIHCDVLILLGTDSQYPFEIMKPIIKLFGGNRRIIIKRIPANHDMHMNNPKLVAENIISFLTDDK